MEGGGSSYGCLCRKAGHIFLPGTHGASGWRRQCAKIYGTFRWTIGVWGSGGSLYFGPGSMAGSGLSHRSPAHSQTIAG